MPTAKVRRATAVNRGARPRLRKTCQSWTLTHPIGSPSRLMWPSRGPEPVWRAYPSNITTSARLLKFEECSQRHRFELVTVIGARLTYSRQRRVFHLHTLCVIFWAALAEESGYSDTAGGPKSERTRLQASSRRPRKYALLVNRC